ncbi:MAG: succinate dehydrogenase, cytochrome b556 subunit [Pseudomonadota bacterium]
MAVSSKSNRPVNLSLTAFKFPFAAIASITHRITGVVLFGAIAFLLWWLDQALASPEGFEAVASSAIFRVLVFLIVVALLYHLFAGIKHLLLDFHFADTKIGGTRAAQTSVVLTLISALGVGLWLW